jgi:membrane protease YdiL (CAAX protease family)
MASAPPQLGPVSLLLRLLGPAVAACAAAWALDLLCRRKGLMPPGFRRRWRRAAAFVLVAAILWVGIFSPLRDVGLEVKLDVSAMSTPQLFVLHVLMAIAVLGWFALGFAGVGGRPAGAAAAAVAPPPAPEEVAPAPPPAPAPPAFGRQLLAQLGLVAPNVSLEVLLGLLLGLGAWLAVLLALLLTAVAVWALGGENALPKPSAIVPWIAALPVLVRVAVSLSAGFVEEIFFRGFLQPRVGILLSTGFFVLAHLSYGQPFMLLGITLLSLIYALLVRWRQTIWPAIAAHALFDGIQLLVIIPLALRMIGKPTGGRAAAAVLAGARAASGALFGALGGPGGGDALRRLGSFAIW